MGNTYTPIISNLRLRYHFYYITKFRKEAIRLIDNEVPCTDPELVNLSNRIQLHGMAASRIWKNSKNGNPAMVKYNCSVTE